MTNKIIERERVPIKSNTKAGYTMACDGDGIDLGLNRANHRGTVKHQISHTIKTEIDCGVIEVGYFEKGTGKHQSNIVYSKEGLCPTLPASTGVKEPPKMFMEDKPKRLFNIYNENYGTGFAGNVWDEDGISPNLMTMQGGNREPLVQEPRLVGGVGEMKSNNGTQYYQQDKIYDSSAVSLCLSANEQFNPNYTEGVRIRKLTPKECWRLMGFKDEDFEKASKVNSDTQLYKQAGNSIVTNVIAAIIKELL